MSIRCDIYDRKLYDIWFAAAPYAAKSKPAKTLRQWAADEGADIVYNLALFNMTAAAATATALSRAEPCSTSRPRAKSAAMAVQLSG